jgi:hypothetical protein
MEGWRRWKELLSSLHWPFKMREDDESASGRQKKGNFLFGIKKPLEPLRAAQEPLKRAHSAIFS